MNKFMSCESSHEHSECIKQNEPLFSEVEQSMVMEEDTSSLVNGPDQLVTCNNLITWDPKGSVKIRMERAASGSIRVERAASGVITPKFDTSHQS